MPYLSWMEGNQPFRHAVVEDPCLLGRDSSVCPVARPDLDTVAPVHAELFRKEGQWQVKALGAAGGTTLNGLPVDPSQGRPLQEGDVLLLGTWRLSFTEGFPGLDGTTFVERVGDFFDEMQAHPDRTFFAELKQLYGATEKLLEEVDSDALEKIILEESLRLAAGDRGLFVRRQEPEGWCTVHQIGSVEAGPEQVQSVLDYVARERTAVLSNRPEADPRFQGTGAQAPRSGPLLCADLADEEGTVGALWLERTSSDRPFDRLDLAILQAFARRGSLVVRHARLGRALDQSDRQTRQALATERLETLRQMAGTLKHEINNPLAVISMQVEMLQRKYPEEVKLAKIGEMADRIKTLLQGLQKIREAATEGYADGSSILKLGAGDDPQP
ncbi:FHA domain-containing protein [Geothrix oryzisoli]|uniref:FHA domain-containing protein n=1 Tax=Geothrix oryzisoli TaxID=2922721 RepID=UPI001FAD47F8|nr:FHA domain-containing protein [Geothrix oryzisoli]